MRLAKQKELDDVEKKTARALKDVERSERSMGIQIRWTMDMQVWKDTEKKKFNREKKDSLNTLKSLIISREMMYEQMRGHNGGNPGTIY